MIGNEYCIFTQILEARGVIHVTPVIKKIGQLIEREGEENFSLSFERSQQKHTDII